MNRTILTVAGVFSASSLLLVDSAVKGTALLVLAAAVATILWRDSAATRHLVWMLAIVAILVVPVLSALLPQWRVLPGWAGLSPSTVLTELNPARPVTAAFELPQYAAPEAAERPAAAVPQPVAALPDSRPAQAAPEITPASAVGNWNWRTTLPCVWAVGFCALLLRLMAARWILWNTERQGTVIWSSSPPATTTHDPLATAAEAACRQLSIDRPITLLVHTDKTIPVVWGILRCHLLLPVAARDWTGEQLRSVLLHELAHVQRRDTTAQLLTQLACALHWFNPLVWLAAWRLDVERERACDDLVLASGVRPSAYAGHLLEVVTGLAPGRWTHSCGLAMARQSSLEGRLLAVLSDARNRRGVTRILAAAAVMLAAAVAIPLAMLGAAAPDKAPDKTEAAAAKVEPKDAASRPLFEDWKSSARTDGKIPGGRIAEMVASLQTFRELNPGHEQSVKLEPLLKKCDASRDWAPAEAAALLDEIAAITPRAEWALRDITESHIYPGKPLPAELANAPWGEPAENGLRIAWLLEPRAKTQPLDSVLKSRVLFHNAGKSPVCFATEDWIQVGNHKAQDADGKEVSVWAVSRLGMRTRMGFRLAPGEYAEVEGHGLGVGSHETSTEQSIYKVGCWIEAKAGDDVTFNPGSVPVSFQTWKNNEGLKDTFTVWQEMIAARVMQESPLPASPADRELLLRRVMRDFPGTAPTAGEIAAFVADNARDSLPRLIKSLQARCAAMHFAGALSGGETKFRVTAAVPKKDAPQPGAQLKPATEQKLKWGEPVNGLRMAQAWPPSLDEPGLGNAAEFYLVVQNVSEAAVRLTAGEAAPNPRRQIMWDNGSPLAITSDEPPIPLDWLLQAGEVALLPLFQSSDQAQDGRTPQAVSERCVAQEKAVRFFPQYSLTAEMRIEKAPAGAWTGKLATGQSRGSVDVIPPKQKDAQELYKSWTTAGRLDGKIPGGVIELLGESVKKFMKLNPTWKTTPQLETMLPRFDASHDWSGPEAVALLDEVAAVQDSVIRMALEQEGIGIIRQGTPLPPELENAPWGRPLTNGLRLAWLLEPRGAEHPLGTQLQARPIIHNAGKTLIAFRAGSWNQLHHKALDAKGRALKIDSREWLTLSRLTWFRLAPGEFVELNAAGIGVGKDKDAEDWRDVRVGSWIEAKAGDDVTVTTEPLPLGDRNDNTANLGEPGWWLDHIKARLARHVPFPVDADVRRLLLYRVAMELFGTPVSEAVNTAFIADATPTALDSLAKNLFHRPGPEFNAWAGPLTSAPTIFRVLPADPDAAKKLRVISAPGWYTLTDHTRLSVTRRPDHEWLVNEGSIQFFSPDQKADPPGKPVSLALPHGYSTWAAAWMRGGTVLWVEQQSGIRSYDFSNPADVKVETTKPDQVPAEIREALRGAFTPAAQPKGAPPAASTKP